MKITETLFEKILATVCGGCLGLDWRVTDADGEPLESGTSLKHGMYVVMENAYGYVVLHVNADISLTQCDKHEEDE
tara:strand:- start:1512 stop:1739 length:228 start_codon:yes stop_codon:yes gene_type:complete